MRSPLLPTLFVLGNFASGVSALDLTGVLPQLLEVRFQRPEGAAFGPQVFRFKAARFQGTDWPAETLEKLRRADKELGLPSKKWSGFLGGNPVFGLSRTGIDRRRARGHISPQFELAALLKRSFTFRARATRPGGRGRALFKDRAGLLLARMDRFLEGKESDPFRSFRQQDDAAAWQERYVFRSPKLDRILVLKRPPSLTRPPQISVPSRIPGLSRDHQNRETTQPSHWLVSGDFEWRLVGPPPTRDEVRWMERVLGMDLGVEPLAIEPELGGSPRASDP